MEALRAFAKYVLSFRRRTWTARDYPLRTRRQENVPESSRWDVRVVRWWTMGGLGATREEALQHLERRLVERRAHAGSLPRPGTLVPIEYAPTTRVDRHPELVLRLLTEVLEVEHPECVFVSDGSRLEHFCAGAEEIEKAHDRIRTVFGVDSSDVEEGTIAAIVERIARHESARSAEVDRPG